MGDVIVLPSRQNVRWLHEVGHIQRAIDSVGMLKPASREMAARNLTNLLDEARRIAGVRRANVARAVEGWENDGVPDKRLDKLTVPRSSDPRILEKRRSRLQAHPDRYTQIVPALASLMSERPGWTRGELLVRLFRGTEIDRKLEELLGGRAVSGDPAQCWQELSSRLDEMSGFIVREAKLDEYARLLSTVRATFNPVEKAFEIGDEPILAHGPLNGNFEVWEEWPPIPSVLLFEECLLNEATVDLALAPTGSHSTQKIQVAVSVYRETLLAIGPADAITDLRPLFEIRTRVDLAHEGSRLTLTRPYIYLPHDEVEVEVGGVKRLGMLTLPRFAQDGQPWEAHLAWPGFGMSEEHDAPTGPLQPEHCYAAWRLATPEVCEELLCRPLRELGHALRLHLEQSICSSLTPEGTIGAAVESALVGSGEPRLEAALFREAQKLASSLNSFVNERRNAALDLHRAASRRWNGGLANE